MNQTELTTLPNLGKVLAERLCKVGIETAEDLQTVGTENVFIRLQTVDEGACLHELMALEGAIQGIRKCDLDHARKQELKMFHKQMQITNKTQK
ncbi:MAG: TfoX/Sxy family protein [Bacteroidales bacterium]|jgi:DNA transformation protein|nr:TfoX/Sxy family protein [Bacteroidales bacterium]